MRHRCRKSLVGNIQSHLELNCKRDSVNHRLAIDTVVVARLSRCVAGWRVL